MGSFKEMGLLIALLVSVRVPLGAAPPTGESISQGARVREDGVAVYKAPDFDSEVISYLDQGKKIKISKKIYPGPGGLGLFYKVRVKKGEVGYITDVDVVPQFIPGGKDSQPKENPQFNRPTVVKKKSDVLEEPPRDIALSRYIGGEVSMVDFAEKVFDKRRHSQSFVYGLRLSGPGALMADYPLDFSLLLMFKAPDYYGDLAETSATGLLLISDFFLPVPILPGRDSLLYTGLGLTLNYSKFDVKVASSLYDSQELRMGLVLPLGWAFRLSKKTLSRFEAKYRYEEQSYTSIGLSLQYLY